MKNKRILFLAATINQLPLILLAKKKGFYTITVDYYPTNIAHKFSDKSFSIDITDKEKILNLAKNLSIDAIIAAYTDVGVPTASYVASKLNLIGPNWPNSLILTNKSDFRNFYKNNIDTTFTYFKINNTTSLNDNKLLFKNRKFIVKPVDSSGSKGISVISNFNEYELAKETAIRYSLTKTIIIEDFIDGEQGTVEGFFLNGKPVFCFITNRLTAEVPNVATKGHVFPSNFSENNKRDIKKLLIKVLNGLSILNGPFNADFVVKENKVHLIEISPRLGGNNLSKLIKYSTGVDVQSLVLKYVLGESINEKEYIIKNKKSYFANIVLEAEKTGLLHYNSLNIDKAKNLDCVVDLEIHIKSDTKVAKLNNGRNALGFVLITYKEEKDFFRLREKIYSVLNFEINE